MLRANDKATEMTVREYVAHTFPGEQASQLRVDLLSGRRVQVPVPVVPPRRELPPRRHSLDFRSASWDGADGEFTATQARILETLWNAYEDGTPDVSGERLLEDAGAERTARIRDLWRGHGWWGRVIVTGGTKGTYRLAG